MKNSRLKLIVSAMFLLIMVGIHAQNVRVTGVVSDAQGSLIGVNVHVKGGTTGVITDINGKYSLLQLRDNGPQAIDRAAPPGV